MPAPIFDRLKGDNTVAEKQRLSRKDIKRPDEFISLTGRGLTWARQNQQMVTWGGVGILVLLIGLGIASAYRGARDRDANSDLSRALAKLNANDYAAASTELIDVSSRWDGTGVATVAGLLGANAAIRAGEGDKAITELTRLQGQSSKLPGYLKQQILVAWGAALETKQQWLDAAAKYQEAAAMTGPYTSEAILGEARTRELGGELERSKQLYRQAYEQFPDLPGRDLVAAKL